MTRQEYKQLCEDSRRYKAEARAHCAKMAAAGRGSEVLRESLGRMGIDLSKGKLRLSAVHGFQIPSAFQTE